MTPIITILTDFGMQDGFVGVMKGVILGIAPGTSIVDISHLVPPQNIAAGAYIFNASAPYFPPGTIHICVVDPGVGTARRPIAARLGSQLYVGPDNGLLTPMLQRAQRGGEPVEIVHLDRPEYWRAEISTSFHGRDIFAPVAAHLARGVALTELGTPIHDPVLLTIPQPERTPHGLRGVIRRIDHFGNLATNISQEDIAGLGDLTVRIGGTKIQGLARTFGDRPPGHLIAYITSIGNLAIAVVNGNAALRFNAHEGDVVEVETVAH